MTIRVSDKNWGSKTKKGRYPVVPKKERTIGMMVFGSKAEMLRAGELIVLEKAGEIGLLTWHPSFDVFINGQHFCTYSADSSYWVKGKQIVEEVKSRATRKDPSYKLRRKAAELFWNIKVKEVIV